MMMKVCVGVLAYNSENTILETLDSILMQTYGPEHVELVVSDDASSDGTVSVVRKWVEVHECRFFKIKVLEQKFNSGVSANFNRLINHADSIWIKPIAADDILMPECLADNTSFINSNIDCKILFSNAIRFEKYKHSNNKKLVCDKRFFNQNAAVQSEMLLTQCNILAPTSFISMDLLKTVGGADERFPMIEDYPLWLKITRFGVKLYANDAFSVYYRSGESLSRAHTTIGNERYVIDSQRFHQQIIWPSVSLIKRLDDRVMFYAKLTAIRIFGNRKSFAYYIFFLCTFLFRPYRILKKIRGFFR
tara:strand:- start:158 stop:1072 length:915 start_codon:yes stop_codon:yes gene_type:complete